MFQHTVQKAALKKLVISLGGAIFLAAGFGPGIAAAQTPPGTIGIPPGEEATWPAEDPSVGVAMDQAGPLIHLEQAQAKYPGITGAGYTVAVIDTGVDYTHPALAGRYVGGYDFVNHDSNPDDDYGHGTHVAGIIASNDAVYTGLAPGVGYAALKVLDSSGSGTWENIEAGLQWVINNRTAYNIVAVNMSLATSSVYNYPYTYILSDEMSALKNDGVFIAAAAGNGWYNHFPNQGVGYPAADPSAVAVGDVWSGDFGYKKWNSGAIDYTSGADRVVSHCDRSTTMLDVLAPGAIITSTAYNWEGANPDFVGMSGTSMATPAVTGLSVLIREAIEENWNPADWPVGAEWQDTILQIMQDSGVKVYDGDDEDDNVSNLNAYFSRIDVLAALDSVVVPEPSTILLVFSGILGLAIYAWRHRAAL